MLSHTVQKPHAMRGFYTGFNLPQPLRHFTRANVNVAAAVHALVPNTRIRSSQAASRSAVVCQVQVMPPRPTESEAGLRTPLRQLRHDPKP